MYIEDKMLENVTNTNLLKWGVCDQDEIICSTIHGTVDIGWINVNNNQSHPCEGWNRILAYSEDNESLDKAKFRIENAFTEWFQKLKENEQQS